MYRLKTEKVTVLLDKPTYEGRFDFRGVIANNRPNFIYMYSSYYWDDKHKQEGYIHKDLSSYLREYAEFEADMELEEYIKKNIDNMDFYTSKDEYGRYSFFDRNVNFYDHLTDDRKYMNIHYDDIAEGIIQCSINCISFNFDIVSEEFKNIHHQYDGKPKKTLLDAFYGGHLNMIIAIEQYKRGTAHKTFTELVNLSKFLEGKKSVKLHLKDGMVVEVKSDRNVYSGQILDQIDGIFYINNSYHMRPMLNKRLPIEELDYLQYGRETYRINTDNLIIEPKELKEVI